MVRRLAPTPPDDDRDEDAQTEASRAAPASSEAAVRDLPDLSSLGIAGLNRRHMAGLLGTLLAVWIVVVFARQVGEASAATARVDQMTVDNAALTVQVEALARELEVIRRQDFIEQQARGVGLGTSREIAFTLAEDAPPLPDDAPGSAGVRLGAEAAQVSPLERWLTLLFGPSD